MKLKMMAVDDDPVVLNVLKTMLELRGYKVMTVTDSRDALKLLEVEKVDGLFVDVEMPHLNGFALTGAVRSLKLNGQVPIVMLTASDNGETMRRGFSLGITFFLGKPFTREKVHKLMGAVKGTMVREQLRYVRIPVRMTVGCSWAYQAAGGSKSDCQNISEGGMRLGAMSGLRVGQGVTLTFTLPDIDEKLIVNGEVVRKEADGVIGMKFVGLHPQDKSSLQRYICSTLKD